MRRSKRKLDMLPLLDVFMVILFVFATIEEGKLEDTTREATEQAREVQQLQQRAESLQKTLDEARLEERKQTLEKTTQALEKERAENVEMSSQLAEAQRTVETLQAAISEAIEKLKEIESNTQKAMEMAFDSDDQYRQQDILDKLLDQNSVFEIEIRGVADVDVGIRNHCCYRDDPRQDGWNSCGEIPAKSDQRVDWFRSGADGLLRTLRQTKGGNAMTIIRQDAEATHQIGAKLEELVREQVPEQKVYNEGIAMIEVQCR